MIKLHIGCGPRDFGTSWISIDGGKFPHVKNYDVTLRSEEAKDFVDIIYSSHLISYFDREEIVPILAKWYLVLKPGGILRLAVPDFEAMSKLYIDHKYKKGPKSTRYSLKSFLGMLYGKMKMDDKFIYHKTVYDKETLTDLLLNVGFKNIRKWDWKQMKAEGYPDDCSRSFLPHDLDCIYRGEFRDNQTLMSLNLEAIK